MADLKLLHRQEYSYLSQDQFDFFIQFCGEKGVNPWLRHIKPQLVFNEATRERELQFIVTIPALRIIALSTGEYLGPTGPSWCGPDGAWVDVWLKKEPPAAATVHVARKGFLKPVPGTATWDAYCPLVEDRGKMVPPAFWLRMGAYMLGKCAEALALRQAFPEKLSGLLTPEETHHSRFEGRRRSIEFRGSGTVEGLERGWDASAPQSQFQFELALCELGLQDPLKRRSVIESFRRNFSGDSVNEPEKFYAAVIAEIRKNPKEFGAATG